MENLPDIAKALPTSPSSVAVEWLVLLPPILAVLAAIATCCIGITYAKVRARKTDEPFDRRIPWGAALLWAAITYTAGNVLIFTYIMLHPYDPRWGTTVTGVDLPDGPEAADLSGVPIAGDVLNNWAQRLTDGVNSTSDSLEGQVNELIAPAIQFYAYRQAFETADQFLLLAAIGACLVLVIAVLLHRGQKRTIKRVNRENKILKRKVAHLERRTAEQDKFIAYQAYCMELMSTAHNEGRPYDRPAYDNTLDYESWFINDFIGQQPEVQSNHNHLMVED